MITIGNRGNGSIGDCLWLTPIFKKFQGTVQLHNDSQCKKVSVIYNNICNVEFTDLPSERIDNLIAGDYPLAQKVLDFFGVTDVNCIPLIKIDEQEIKWAEEKLKQYKNPIAILAENAGTGRNDNPGALYRDIPKEYLDYIAKELRNKDYTPIQFGLSSSNKNIENTEQILDLSLRQMAACYKVIGKHIGGDTGGGCHLALSVGAKAYVLIPEHDSFVYNYNKLHFHDYLWKNEPIRINYINFKNFKNIIDLF
jgi:hypothetical protein